MRARLARPRRVVRGRLVAPVAAAAAVALVGGVVVAAPDAPTVSGDVQTVAGSSSSASPLIVTGFTAGGAEFSVDLRGLVSGVHAGIVITGVEGLPTGLVYNSDTGMISGQPTASGTFTITVNGTVNGLPVSVPVTLVVNNTDGTVPAGTDGSLGGEAQAGGQVTTGSSGTDAILGAVVNIVTSIGGQGAADLVTGSLGTGGPTPGNPDENPTGPFGSDANGQIDLGSLGGTNPDGSPNTGSLTLPGSSGTVEGEVGGGVNAPTGPLGSLTQTEGDTTTGSQTGGTTQTGGVFELGGDLTTGGQVEVPGSSVDTGSLGTLAPGLAFTGAALLGLAGLGLALGGGSSTPGSSALLPALPGSTTTGGTTNGGSLGSTAPTVAAGAPRTAPGPTVANGRG